MTFLRLPWCICSHFLLLSIILIGSSCRQGGIRALALSTPHRRSTTGRRVQPLHRRPDDPFAIETNLLEQQQYEYILGSDESGAGCIAGPIVCVSCCILNATQMIQDCNVRIQDGKRLTIDECTQIRQYADAHDGDNTIRYVATIRSNIDIDRQGVYQSVQDGFRESILSLVSELLPDHDESSSNNNTTTVNADEQQQQQQPKTNSKTTKTTKAMSKTKTKKQLICSIVDGHRSPSFSDFTSRPWPQGDATVYTVAVAGCLARALHAQIMADYCNGSNGVLPSSTTTATATAKAPSSQQQLLSSVLSSSSDDDGSSDDDMSSSSSSSSALLFRDCWDGGYPTSRHLEALATHGPTAWHRRSCKPVQQFMLMNRRSSLSSFLLLGPLLLFSTTTTTSVDPANAMIRERGMLLPERGEIAAAVPTDWSEEDIMMIREPLRRLDEKDDTIFYQDERFVEHIDETAVAALQSYLATVVLVPINDGKTTRSVLDVGASWTSHLKEDPATKDGRLVVVGIGMNGRELAANTVLSKRLVQDLNVKTTLPLDSDSFDIVLCQLTIDYLTRPVTVCKELRRVLKKKKDGAVSSSGAIHVVFSNRLFLQKAVENWTGRDDLDHVETVATYLHAAGFRNIEAQDLSVRNKRGSIVGDPLYVVRAEA
jgi:ribonuclease HII/SAM-dependent methyltransferase